MLSESTLLRLGLPIKKSAPELTLLNEKNFYLRTVHTSSFLKYEKKLDFSLILKMFIFSVSLSIEKDVVLCSYRVFCNFIICVDMEAPLARKGRKHRVFRNSLFLQQHPL
jgi:hypothetical protein